MSLRHPKRVANECPFAKKIRFWEVQKASGGYRLSIGLALGVSSLGVAAPMEGGEVNLPGTGNRTESAP